MLEDETRGGRIKRHLVENKKTYLACVGVAGFSCLLMRKNSDLLCGSDSELLSGSEARSFFLFSRVGGNQTTKAVTTIHTGTKGHPGFVTRCLETNELFANQNDAARAFDISPSILSSHLNGKFDDAQGYHFERLGIIA